MDAPQATQQPAATEAKQEGGNVPADSVAAPAASGFIPGAVQVSLVRGPDGRLRNPNKPIEEAAKDPRLGEKRQTIADLNSPKSSSNNDLEQATALKGGIQGLDAIPKHWPELPDNVSQGVELGWVQANRLKVVKEQPGKPTKVDLSKARTPAPSWAALSWLETSIRSYAKYIEVASKQASSGQDEAEFIRKERMAIAEIDALLAEMYDAEKG